MTTAFALIAERARLRPSEVAVESGPDRVTYAELTDFALDLAAALRAAGIRRGDLVGVAAPRDVRLVGTLLGVLASGAAYVPLDPGHPPERLAHILGDARARALVTTGPARAGLSFDGPVVLLDDLVPARADLPDVSGHDAAYVIYTSGSTGRPKGVMVSHAALANFLTSMLASPGVPEGVVFPAITTVSFDIAALELYLPLLAGGRVVVAGRDEARDPEKLAELLRRTGARHLQATPTTWRILLDSGWRPPEGFRAFCGGEKLPAGLGDRLGCELWDLYGPTETTVWSSVARVTPSPSFAPVAGTTLHVLDERLEPAETGELHIGGDGLAVGYWSRSALTADRFLPDPFSARPGARLYRTGDIARVLADGRVEILGRTDDQIKIRGFRVEPGEIEAVLCRASGVRAAVVRAVAAGEGDLRLVAYLQGAFDEEELREHCARALPAHMVPVRYVPVDVFPTTPNGKLDRAALPAPAAPRPEEGRTPQERVVAAAFADVLGLPAGVDDDFFALGGHSLLATRLANRLRAELGIDLPISAVFDHPTVEGLAAVVAAAPPAARPQPVPRDGEAIPLSHGQRALWFLDRLHPGGTAYLESFAVPLDGPVDPGRLRAALSRLVERHDILRTRYLDGPVQVVDPARPFELTPAEDLFGPIDLAAEPPVRVAAGPSEALFVVHHIASDDRTEEILTADLRALYRGEELPPLPIRYADFAAERRPRPEGLRYWRERLDGAVATAPPTDRPRPAEWDPSVGTVRFTVPALARGDATAFMTHLAAFFGLLSRVTGETDLSVGVPLSNRGRPELENVAGLFVNPVVMRADLSEGPSFDELVAQVRDTAVAAYANDDVPFEVLVEELAPVRDLSRNPLFQVMFTMHGQTTRPRDAGGAKFDQSWHLTERPDGGFDGHVDYATALYDEATVQRLARYYAELVRAVAADPRTPIARLPLATTGVPLAGPPPGETLPVHRAVEAQAAKTPDAVAVTGPHGSLTYAELDRRANRLAHHLIARGARPGELVAVRLPRSPGLLVALLAVLKSGAAYIPQDPRHPRGAGAALTITADTVAGDQPATRPDVEVSPDDLAYVVYTSGSTGEPKGVMITHGGLANYLAWALDELRPEGVVPLHTSIAYDLVLTSVYPPLAAGATIVLADEDDAGADALANVPGRPFGLVKLTPTHLGLLAADSSLTRRVVVGGEQLHGDHLPALGRTTVVNSYGPTEITIACCAHTLTAADARPGPVPIGGPLPGVTLHVLDDAMNPVPPGLTGELHVGGPGVARGYLGDPALTAARFLPGPDGTRLYRTGDLVRQLPSGDLEFVGRRDRQLKVHGFRVEPGEIEQAITAHPKVRAAAVVFDGRLSAHVVADDLDGLREFVAARLPRHMVPDLWGLLPELPLTGNGKLDRRRLPALTPVTTAQAPPATPAEHRIAAIWADLLGLDTVGVDDDVFTLGAQSVLATRAAARIGVSVRDVFRFPTVRALAARTAAAEVIGRADRSKPLPLSPAQHRLWFLDQLMPGRTDYLVVTALRLRGPLDVAGLSGRLDRVVARHEILRTRYLPGPVQVVDPPVPLSLKAEPVDPADLLADLVTRPIDLAAGPVFTARLARVSDEEHVLALVVHHIATDGWSTGVLARELAGDLPDLTIQYADYAAWQHSRPGDASMDYWRRRLAGLEPAELLTDRPRPAVADPRGAGRPFTISPEVAGRLAEIGRSRGATPYMTLLAGFFALLARLTGGADLTVGSPVSGRDRPETHDLIGFFVNTVVLRADLSGDPTFGELVDQVRRTAHEAFGHDVPFERLVEELAPERDLSRNPLFQILFAYRDEAEERFALPGLEVTPEAVPWRTAKFDLTVELTRRADGGLDGLVEYATALFDPATVDRFVGCFERLLTAVTPDVPIAALPLLDADEVAEIDRLAAGPVRPRGELGLPELIAADRSEAVAVRSDHGTLTYRELNERADALAARLRAAGVRRDDVVGVRVPRSPDMVVAMLGVQRAGAAVLPLDPGHPAGRNAWVIANAGAKLVIDDLDDLDGLPGGPESGPVGTEPDALAYVIYTSGSTGRPKGVAVPHRGIRNRVMWAVERFGIGPGDRMLQKTAITFDAAMWEVFAPLVCGAEVVLAPPGAERDPAVMAASVARHGVTILQAVPSVWRHLADELRPGSLRLLFSAGEPLTRELADRLPAPVVNTYGPTECSIDVTAWARAGETGETVPIGLPLDNTGIHVLDDGLRPVPIGVPGELCVSGENLARGYLGLPRRTAESFVPHRDGGRLYRTGDVVRRDADGVLHFLGRRDHQVKIRGVRVEPGEVEAVLAGHEGVASGVVVARPGPDGRPRLIGYVVPRDGMPADLADYLLARLPAPYVPSVFVEIDRLPLTTTGKTDRNALPDPAPNRAEPVPPATGAERAVAAVWADVLGLDEVGATEDFFTLGGHSLMAVRVTARLGLPVQAIFENRTVAALARLLDQEPAAAPLVARPRPERIPLSFAQRRLWILDQLDPGSAEYHVTWSFHLTGDLDADRLTGALKALADRHEILRTRYAPGPVQVVEPAAVLGDEPFDLAARPPIRTRLTRIDDRNHVLSVVLHHIACDGWSEEVMARELAALYAGEELGAPPLQYADYALWQHEQPMDHALAYWRDRLAGLPRLDLPTDRPRPPVRDGRGASATVHVPAGVAAELVAVGRARGATPYMTFLAVFATLLHRYTGAVDVPVGTPVAGRNRPELHDVVGFFVNTVVLRCDLGDDPAFADLVGRVRDTALDAFRHDELPFDVLVEELAPQRDLARTPLFDVLFELRESAGDTPALPGLEVRRIVPETTTAKFELTLALRADGDGGYFADVEYATALFDAATVDRLTGHFLTLARSAARTPDAPLSRLGMLTEAELRHHWNPPAAEETPESLPEAFAAQAARTPGAVAVDAPDARLTYAELDERSTELAERLRARGVRPERPVAVLMEKSSAPIVALLAIAKAGGVYAPLDPGQPTDRLRRLLDDLHPAVVLTGGLDGPREAGLPAGDPDRLAYLIYTSGSTGMPKAVMVPHRAYVHHCRVIAGTYDIRPGDRVLLLAALTFDVAMDQIAATLLAGATVVVGENRFWTPAELPDRLAEHRITHMEITPAYYREMMSGVVLHDARLRGLRLMNVGSDVVTHDDARRWLDTGLPARFLCTYGPTEATVTSVVHPVREIGADAPEATLPIGAPVPGTGAYVLDAAMNPVPVGVPGELYLAGTRLARGYLGRPGQTADRFVPFEGGARLYRTGDLVRRRPDGVLDFLGRVDDQVKVRGFRIELGEIEAALAEHPEVRACAVAVSGGNLVGYVVTSGGSQGVAFAGLRAHLAERLPGYMVPALWVALDALPLTASKKVDRRALPPPGLAPADHTPPRDEVEQAVADVWAEVLGRPEVGVHDEFFEIGGHSLLATRVMTRLADLFGIEVPLRVLFEATTVAAQAAALERIASMEGAQ
ncbi:amino acid adenylation domain-containing protein [Herbidospora galbida]|uniref:Amino acid adenylation domain-containing protein n=1 Tax=Herbidospora galbida TaxID=2575442 RepID=A0A4V5V0I2_9ACTN|nr:non-ribosomal peptide synthetase [Herbidospora galbida]TKK87203.1 amino acid adenylation domain-containing protein [Herbidospora galbida]